MSEVFLNDICTIKSSKRIFEEEYVENGIPFIRGQEISNGTIGKPTTKYECYISQKRFNEIKQHYGVPQKGDILITAVGTIGNLSYIDSDFDFYFKDGNVIQFTNFSPLVFSQYLCYFMKSTYFKKQLNNALIGAVQKALTIVMLKNIKFELPSLVHQKKVAYILSSIDKKINNNKRINDNLAA